MTSGEQGASHNGRRWCVVNCEEKIERASRLAEELYEGCLPRQAKIIREVCTLLDEVREDKEAERQK